MESPLTGRKEETGVREELSFAPVEFTIHPGRQGGGGGGEDDEGINLRVVGI